jgi:hypothetical protein
MDKRILVPLVAFGVVVAAAIHFVPRQDVARGGRAHIHQDVSKEDSAAEIDALRAEVAALRQELRSNAAGVSALQAEAGRLSNAVAVASAQAEEAFSRPPPGPEPALARNSPERAAWEAERQAMLAETESKFLAEPRDSGWSPGVTTSIREAANRHAGVNNVLRTLDCRSKSCRLEVADEEATALDVSRFLVDCGAIFPKVVANRITSPDGKASYVYYMMNDV